MRYDDPTQVITASVTVSEYLLVVRHLEYSGVIITQSAAEELPVRLVLVTLFHSLATMNERWGG